jgi:excisionase family DNA binding protein
MAIEIEGQKYFRTSEACQITGISRSTLFRWLKMGVLDRTYKDRRGWRIFSKEDLKKIQIEATRIEEDNHA